MKKYQMTITIFLCFLVSALFIKIQWEEKYTRMPEPIQNSTQLFNQVIKNNTCGIMGCLR